MRDLLLGILIFSGLAWGLFSARGSIIILNWVWFQRPYDFSWGFWNTIPAFQIFLAVAIISNLLRGLLQFRFPLLLFIYIVFLFWITISTFLAYNSELAWITYKRFLPSMWVAPVFLFFSIHDLQLLKWVLWAFSGGVGLNAFKVSLALTASGGGHLTDQISGFVGDNNVFGLVLCLVLTILLGLRKTLPGKRWLQLSFYIFLGFIVLCIIYTKSRGALLSVGIIFLLSSLLSKKPARNLCLLVFLVSIIYMAIPASYFDRLSTLQDTKLDTSAMGRIENWQLSWNEALRYPFFGVGPDNHIYYNKSLQSEVQVRVAHSIYFQILGELGFVGLGIYLWFMGLGLWIFLKTSKSIVSIAKANPDLAWVQDLSSWMAYGYIGYIFGSGFLNMLYIEFPWYMVFYGSMLYPLVNRELRKNNLLRFGENIDSQK